MPYPLAAVRGGLGLLGGKAAVPVTYLLRDVFTTPDDAPMTSPHACEPGPENLTIVQLNGNLSTSGGLLSFPAQGASNAWAKQGFYDAIAFARTAGRAFFGTFNLSAINGTSGMIYGWGSAGNLTVTNAQACWNINSAATELVAFYNGTANVNKLHAALATSTEYVLYEILRSTGSFLVIKIGANYKLVWVDATSNFANCYPLFSNNKNAGTIAKLSVCDLGTPWNNDYGIVTQRLAGARTAGDTFAHTADCILEWTVTTRADGQYVYFRKQDATNFWRVGVDSSGNITLNEVVDGTPTERATASGVSNGNRVVVIASGSTITIFVADVWKCAYASATNFATATAGVVNALGTGGAISDLISWPIYITGTALTALSRP